MILVILAVVWILVLAPKIVRRVTNRQFMTVRSFRRFLLFGTTPALARGGSMPGAVIGFSAASQRVHTEQPGYSSPAYAAPVAPPSWQAEPEILHADLPPITAVTTSPVTASRRRVVMITLAGATALFFLIGLLPGATVMWDLALFTLGLTATYVALVIHFHRLSVERAQKVIALETRRYVATALDARRHIVASAGVQVVGGQVDYPEDYPEDYPGYERGSEADYEMAIN